MIDISEHIKLKIENQGPISIAEFMSLSMNRLDSSYYRASSPIGKNADFITAPEVSQLFGEIIGIWCAQIWNIHNKPSNINLIELGPGRGTLMKDLLRSTKNISNFHHNINIYLVEINESLQQEQKQNIQHQNVKWYKKFEEIEPKFSIIIANEFFDALPINQFVKKKGVWFENVVGLDKDKNYLYIHPQALKSEMEEYLIKEYNYIQDDGLIEVSDESSILISFITKTIKEYGGTALIIDYGYIKNLCRNFISTLQSVKNHKFHPIFDDIGNADLSAHVNFCLLSDIAKLNGGIVYGPITQKDFLLNMYMSVRRDMLLAKARSELEIQTINSGYNRLIDSAQMGNLFKAMMISNIEILDAGF